MREHKLLYGIDDVLGLCLECVHCDARVHLPIKNLGYVPNVCPVCSMRGADLYSDNKSHKWAYPWAVAYSAAMRPSAS